MRKIIFFKILILITILSFFSSCSEKVDPKIVDLESKLVQDSNNKEVLINLLLLYSYNNLEFTIKGETLIRKYLEKNKNDSILNLLFGFIMISKARYEENIIKRLMWLKIGFNYIDKASSLDKENLSIRLIILFLNACAPPEIARYRFAKSDNEFSKQILMAKAKSLSAKQLIKINNFINYYFQAAQAAKKCIEDEDQNYFKNKYSFIKRTFFEDIIEEREFLVELFNQRINK